MMRIALALAIVSGALTVGCADEETFERVELDLELLHVYAPEGAKSPVCQLHGQVRTNTMVPVAYGFPTQQHGPDYVEATRTQFPNSWNSIPAGCVVIIVNGKSSPTQVVASVCLHCRQAEEKWLSQHEKSRLNNTLHQSLDDSRR